MNDSEIRNQMPKGNKYAFFNLKIDLFVPQILFSYMYITGWACIDQIQEKNAWMNKCKMAEKNLMQNDILPLNENSIKFLYVKFSLSKKAAGFEKILESIWRLLHIYFINLKWTKGHLFIFNHFIDMRTTVSLSISSRKNVFLLTFSNKNTFFPNEMDKLTVVLMSIKWLNKKRWTLVENSLCHWGKMLWR